MTSKTEICNMSISHLGIGKEIASIDTEQSQEASACRRFFDSAKEATLADLSWTFATKFKTLGLIEENPTDEWTYSYRYPVDCLNMRRILSGNRNDTQGTRVPFKMAKDAAGRLIYTDQVDAQVEYTENIKDISLFSAEFNLAFSFRLASYMAPRLTGGDPFKMKQEMLAQYDLEINLAKKKNMNEETQDLPPESELISIRN